MLKFHENRIAIFRAIVGLRSYCKINVLNKILPLKINIPHAVYMTEGSVSSLRHLKAMSPNFFRDLTYHVKRHLFIYFRKKIFRCRNVYHFTRYRI